MKENAPFIICLAIINAPLYLFLGKIIFGDFEDFKECVGYWFTPDSWSFFRGEFFDDFWAETKLLFYSFICIATVAAEFVFISKHLPFVINLVNGIFIESN